MAFPRSSIIDLDTTPFYHVMARCVRGSYLCGFVKETQKDYSHRKQWIVDKMMFLAQIFAIKICAYAVMSNHYHLVLFVDEVFGKSLDDEAVFERWKRIFPTDARRYEHLSTLQKIAKINLWRERLMSISWLMRCLNEDIAKRANAEDDCLGRFWAGRFKSQALLDNGAILNTMVYVDLNPLRANIASTPELSDFTSIQERIAHFSKQIALSPKSVNKSKYDTLPQPENLMSFLSSKHQNRNKITLPISFSDYLELVDYTARLERNDGKAIMSDNLVSIFERIELHKNHWGKLKPNFFSYAVGNLKKHKTFGKKMQSPPIKGASLAELCYLS